jgi:hypothetical protein
MWGIEIRVGLRDEVDDGWWRDVNVRLVEFGKMKERNEFFGDARDMVIGFLIGLRLILLDELLDCMCIWKWKWHVPYQPRLPEMENSCTEIALYERDQNQASPVRTPQELV